MESICHLCRPMNRLGQCRPGMDSQRHGERRLGSYTNILSTFLAASRSDRRSLTGIWKDSAGMSIVGLGV